ncbi:decarboxylating 6-phosphogluconate dehydrogenase [Paenibacillus sp. GD4]|uniref:phosphogluconate dehydrogenase (NAD(+)-dependent, decarboxylating) n=1 Tax=Paenibacillus sp. GD4 TaxID=3068890 RepID=UPI002796A8D8|nr:decarboxylating 6-phosphogluconate dehydrogenase [Paenibacillus sp. GD4]MDQ1909320.1 decarboxylating 6-phosphogluconate dehydrogenase [Paenibacillus sp. GD4]
MQIGLIGLGKMGYNLSLNLLDHGYETVVYDVNAKAVQRSIQAGGIGTGSVEELVLKLTPPRVIWLMVPAGELTESVLRELVPLLSEGDMVIDGGNSHYKDSIRRAAELRERGVYLVDVGTSGGIEGARNGVCTMIGGDKEVFDRVEPIFQDISVNRGYLYAGPCGSGHFLKMIHNGIEYGMMQAIAEGFEILHSSPFAFDYEQVARVWNHGSVIRSWLMELTEHAFSKDPELDSLKGIVQASGEGQWTVETALEYGTAAPVIALSLMMRFRSQQEDTFSGKVVAAMRNEFGGHRVVSSEESPAHGA